MLTLPKMVYLPSRWGCLAYVMKNWDLFVSGPEFAMARIPRLLNCTGRCASAGDPSAQHGWWERMMAGHLKSGSDFVREGLAPDALTAFTRT